MADFKPRGAPNSQPQDPYAGWDLIHRNTMTPAGVYQKGDETAYGWAWPSMITEPVNALARLLDTPAGTMPNPQDPVVDAKGANWRDIQYNGQFYDANELAQIAKDLEYEGLLIRNVVDSKISAGAKPADTYFKFSPEGIRSVNAAFDPAKADSSFLLASDTGKPSLLGAALAGYDPNWPFNK